MAQEFNLIAQYFTHPVRHADLGVGDDAALLRVSAGHQLAVSTDMLVAGTHFFADTDPWGLGWKAAAVNISDLAAMGAKPKALTLALALPAIETPWLAAFSSGFLACCQHFDADWIGGDTTRGPLNLCVTAFGEVPHGQAICRHGANAGDEIWVSGQPGLAALGLQHLLGQCTLAAAWQKACLQALQQPQPRVALGLALRSIASAMLDVSDGLCGDLAHILDASALCGVLHNAALPLAAPLAACGDLAKARQAVLAGGDDYELLFTAAPQHHATLQTLGQQLNLPLHCIGLLEAGRGLFEAHPDGQRSPLAAQGFQHF